LNEAVGTVTGRRFCGGPQQTRACATVHKVVDPLQCAGCGVMMRITALIDDGEVPDIA
jgi:hypothetical protein